MYIHRWLYIRRVHYQLRTTRLKFTVPPERCSVLDKGAALPQLRIQPGVTGLLPAERARSNCAGTFWGIARLRFDGDRDFDKRARVGVSDAQISAEFLHALPHAADADADRGRAGPP